MTLTDAIAQWTKYQVAKAAFTAKHGKEPKAAAEVIKAWFRAHPGTPVYKGIAYSRSSAGKRLDPDLVRGMLSPKQVEKCEVEGTRETLTLLPKPAAKKAPAKKA